MYAKKRKTWAETIAALGVLIFSVLWLRARPIITSTVSRDAQRSATATRSAARRG